jgi:hypothetical protein
MWAPQPLTVPNDQSYARSGPVYPMQVYNGATRPNPARNNGQDLDTTPIMFRRYVNMGYTDVQLNNGLRWGVGKGSMFTPYPYFQSFTPRIPGQTRGDVSGFVKTGPSPYNVQDWANAGAGMQPEHPGGPGMIAGTRIYNPMSG